MASLQILQWQKRIHLIAQETGGKSDFECGHYVYLNTLNLDYIYFMWRFLREANISLCVSFLKCFDEPGFFCGRCCVQHYPLLSYHNWHSFCSTNTHGWVERARNTLAGSTFYSIILTMEGPRRTLTGARPEFQPCRTFVFQPCRQPTCLMRWKGAESRKKSEGRRFPLGVILLPNP